MKEADLQFQLQVDKKATELSRLISQRAPVPRVRKEIADLRAKGKAAGEPELAYVENALRGLAMYEMHEQSTPFLAENADKTPDSADLDSWDYRDEDGSPPPGYAQPPQKKAARLAAFRKRVQ